MCDDPVWWLVSNGGMGWMHWWIRVDEVEERIAGWTSIREKLFQGDAETDIETENEGVGIIMHNGKQASVCILIL
ncbi:hypothetical protein C8R48DRAFT_688356 [Suillus tomentosus]|nr:hypothetical protein C8R48DRAFT_688356 [Suillus tomentosus]